MTGLPGRTAGFWKDMSHVMGWMRWQSWPAGQHMTDVLRTSVTQRVSAGQQKLSGSAFSAPAAAPAPLHGMSEASAHLALRRKTCSPRWTFLVLPIPGEDNDVVGAATAAASAVKPCLSVNANKTEQPMSIRMAGRKRSLRAFSKDDRALGARVGCLDAQKNERRLTRQGEQRTKGTMRHRS